MVCKNHSSRPNPRTVLQGSAHSSCLGLESPEEGQSPVPLPSEPAPNEMETGGSGQSREGTQEPQGLVASCPESSGTGGAGVKTRHLSCLSLVIAVAQTLAPSSHPESPSLAAEREMESLTLAVLL